jgi:hypothetical protein
MDKITDDVTRLYQASNFDFIYPSCGDKRLINGEKIQDLKKYHKVKLKCRCGHAQPCLLERRHQNPNASKLHGIIYHVEFYNNNAQNELLRQ